MVRTTLAGLLALALVGGAAAQDEWSGAKGKSDCWKDGKPKPWEGYNKGVEWTQPIDAAIEKAKKEHKPLMVFHLVGDLDKDGCWAAGHVMRTVTFSDPKVAKLINENFVATWVNRSPKFHNCEVDTEVRIATYSGEAYATRNFCTFFVTSDLDVLHYAAGYYRPTWFLPEAEFALAARLEGFDDEMKPKRDHGAIIARLHEKHAQEHKRQESQVKDVKPDLSGGSDASARTQQNLEYLREALNYLKQLHGTEAKGWRAQKPSKLHDVIKGYTAPNVFTEE